MSNNTSFHITKNSFQEKWVFSENNINQEKKFSDYFKVTNTIATLYNKAFVIKKMDLENNNYTINDIKLESTLIKYAYSPKSLKYGKKNL